MAFVIADRVRETTTTTGTGAVTLAGAYTSFQTFSAAIGNANNTYYTIASAATGEWEVGIGTYTSLTNSLSRDTVLASSNSGSPVSFSAGTKDVFVTQPAERSLLVNSANNGVFSGAATFTIGDILYASSTTNMAKLAIGTNGYVLQSNGSAPTWAAPAYTGTVTSVSFTGGIVSVANATTTPALTVAGTSGGIPYFSSTSAWASSAALAANALMVGGGAGAAPSTITTGTGVVTALGVNTGTAGAFVVNGGALGTPSSGTLTNATGLPISSGVSGLGTGVATALAVNTGSAGAFTTNNVANTFSATQTIYQIVNTNNAVTVTSNAGTVPITYRLNTFTNSSAATMTITMATTSAVDGQMSIVRIYDFSAVAQTISWVNTENSTVTVPTTSNGSTTLPLTVGFMYNSATSKWRCIASA